MDYIVYKRFRAKGIDGFFNLRFGTVVNVVDEFLHAPDGRRICAVTSENGWEHFRPNTPEGAERQEMVSALRKYYSTEKGGQNVENDLYWRELGPEENDYWLQQLRTMPTERMRTLYQKRIGGSANVPD